MLIFFLCTEGTCKSVEKKLRDAINIFQVPNWGSMVNVLKFWTLDTYQKGLDK